MSKTKKKNITFSLDEKLIAAIKLEASDRVQPLSWFVSAALMSALKSTGSIYLKRIK